MSTGPPPIDPGQAALVRGATIGRYVVLGLVGRGGMGEVYAAYDPELDRKVAVKLLRVKPGAGVSLAEGRQRTLREAQAIARLSHPNVVVVYDVGTFRDQVFIAMEFVDGNTVTYWVESQARSWQEVLKIFMSAGRGLMAAHEKGLVHRDFKPDNVMVGRDAQVRVMDFGLARQVQRSEGGERTERGDRLGTPNGGTTAGSSPGMPIDLDPMTTVVLNMPATGPKPESQTSGGSAMFEAQLTRTGATMGTPAYMAPEQFLGMHTDARTDQFSFCVALYEALYRERPFAGNTMFALTSNVVQGNVRDAPASSNVPLWVRRVLLRGLRAQPSERWPSMSDLIDALGNDPSAKRKQWAGLAAGALALLAVGVGFRQSRASYKSVCSGGPAKLADIWELPSTGDGESPRQARIHGAFLRTGKSYAADAYTKVSRVLTSYAQSWANMHKEACEATQLRGEQSSEVMDLRMTCLQERLGGLHALTDVFSVASGEVVENAVSAANALGSLDRCADVPLLRAIVRPPEDLATRARVTDLHTRLASLKASFDAGHLRRALKDAPAIVDAVRVVGYKPLLAEALALVGNMWLKANNSVEARRALTEAFLAADASRHDEVRADVAANMVFVVGYEEGHFDEAKRWAETADAVLQRMGGHELLQAWLLNDLGLVLQLHGEPEAALRMLQEALSLKESARGGEHPDVGLSEVNVALALAGLGRNQEALTHIDRSLVILENGLGAGHPELATALVNRGEILNALGRFREARQSLERARIIWERELGIDNRYLGYALTGVGISYLGEGTPTSALVPLERAFKIRQAQEADPAKRAETCFALARALWDSNRDRARARVLAEEARTTYAKTAGNGKVQAEVEGWLESHRSS